MAFNYESTKDGTVITGIPVDPETLDEAGFAELDAYLAQARASGIKSFPWGGIPEESPAEQPATEEQQSAFRQFFPKDLKDFGEQAVRQAGLAARGLVQGVTSIPGIVIDPVVAAANMVLPENMQQATPRQLADSLMQHAGVPQPETNLEKIAAVGYNAMGGGGGSSAVGGVLTKAPGMLNTIGQTMAANIGQQVTGDIVAGSASEIARQRGANPLVQTGIGLAAGAGSGLATGMARKPVNPGIVDEAENAGIRLMTSDVLPPETFAAKWLQGIGEKIPITGTGGARRAQQAERIAAVDDIIRQYGADDLTRAATDVTSDLISKRSTDIGKWSGEKKEVISRLSEAAQGTPVPITKTEKAIDDSIDYLNSLKSKQNEPVILVLKDWKQALQGQTLDNIETLRKQVGEAFTAPEMSAARGTGEKILSGIYGPLKEDMGNYIKAVGSEADYTKWSVANKELSKIMEELDLPVLKTVLERGEATPEVVQRMLFSSNRSDVAALYRNLSEEGRAAARTAVISKAAYKAGEIADPDKFAAEIAKMGNQTGVLFSGDDLKQLKGLVNVLNMTKRAGQASVMANNGIQAVIPAGALGLGALGQSLSPGMPGVLQAGGAAAAIGLGPRIYESKPIRNILINLSKVSEGTPEAKALTAVLMNAIATENARMQGDTTPVKKQKSEMLN